MEDKEANMSVELRQLRGRVEAQERITLSLCVSFGEVKDRLQEITTTMATKEDIKQLSESVDSRFKQVDDRFTQVDDRFNQIDDRFTQFSESVDNRLTQFSKSVDTRFEQFDNRLTRFSESVDTRFEHVYGALADLQANVGEIRTILAKLVGRLEQR